MPSNFSLNFQDNNNDTILADHVKQFAKPLNDLESGTAFYREATSSGADYVVDFRASAIPGGSPGNYLNSLQPGQIVTFKADADSSNNAQLQVQLEGTSAVSVPIHAGDNQIGVGDIKENQIVVAIYNDTTNPRFDIAGTTASGGGVTQLSDLSDVILSSPAQDQILQRNGSGQFVNRDLSSAGIAAAAHAHPISEVTNLRSELNAKEDSANKGSANGYAGLDSSGKVPASQLPSGSTATIGTGQVAFGDSSTGAITSSSDFTYDGTDLTYSSSNNSPQFLGAGTNSTRIGPGASATNSYGLAIGSSAAASGDYAIALGGAAAASANGVAIGRSSSAYNSSVGIGINATVSSSDSIAIGPGAAANNQDVTSIGHDSSASARYDTAVGVGASASGSHSVALGHSATSSDIYSTAIGYSTTSSERETVALGSGASATGTRDLAIGPNASASGGYGIAIGYSASIGSALRAVAIGNSAVSNNVDSLALGYGAETTASNQLVVGSASATISEAYIGKGVANSSPAGTILGTTGGSGTDVGGADLTLCAGLNTGAGSPGSLKLATGTTGSSGSTLSARTTVVEVTDNKMGLFGSTPVAQSTGWTVTNPSTRKTFDTTSVTVQQLAEVVGTVVDYLKSRGDFA